MGFIYSPGAVLDFSFDAAARWPGKFEPYSGPTVDNTLFREEDTELALSPPTVEGSVATFLKIGSVHVYDYGNGFVRQWGKVTDASATGGVLTVTNDLAIAMKNISECDIDCRTMSSAIRAVQLNDMSAQTNTRLSFRRNNTAAKAYWSVFGEKAN